MRLLPLAILLGLTGCTGWQPDNLLSAGCSMRSCVGDTCKIYCETQETVTRKCAQKVKRFDDGTPVQKDGCSLDKKKCLVACTEYREGKKDLFRVWLWKEEAWRDGHETCHIAIFREFGKYGDHSKCAKFGAQNEKPGKRMR